MATMQDFQGLQFAFTEDPILRKTYNDNNNDYATSSHQIDHDMFPGLIALPKNDQDIQNALKFARDNDMVVSVATGAHQYSGACSTHRRGIQLKLGSTYKGPQDLIVLPAPTPPNEDKTWVYASVSHSLGEFNAFLKANKLFVPHGQCVSVHLGGHGQTGGYGQLGRSFGLLGDHIRMVRLIAHDGTIKEVTAASEPELFWAILGGSPGNFGVITHYVIEVHRDADHDFLQTGARPHGVKGVWLYSESTVKLLLEEVAAMAEDVDIARNFDLCVSVLSSSFQILKLLPELTDNLGSITSRIAEAIGVNADMKWPACIVLYAQWVPMDAEDRYTPKVDAWFEKFRRFDHFLKYWCLSFNELVQPMSAMTGDWIFRRKREFDHPFEKRTYLTDSTTLLRDGWAGVVAERISQVIVPSIEHFALWDKCYTSVQIQCFGGKNSKFRTNRDNGTAYSWRDSSVCATMDCFYEDGDEGKALAKGWQAGNDKVMIGPDSTFSKQDKRVLWGSYGDWDMDKTWMFYHEDEAKYEKLGRQRHLADPEGLFTPNPFCVRAKAD